MNEPLTFTKRPQWHNQPLHLTRQQCQNPLLILNDFFRCYDLNETRKLLWEWLTEVISSSRSISIEGCDRSNHIHFYEKVEEVIEAAFVIKNEIKQKSDFEFVKKDVTFNKPKQLVEFVNDAPLYVITEVFKEESLCCISSHLKNWLQVALSDDSSIYEIEEQRQQLIAFNDALQLFIEALFVFCFRKTNDEVIKEKFPYTIFRELNEVQIANPGQVIAAFYEKFPVDYIQRELNDWLESGISYAGTYPDTMSELQALHTYRTILCLVKSARRLVQES
jgi:hypothetical protein